MNAGFPPTGIGLGIVSALELPVSVMMAFILLNEDVNLFSGLNCPYYYCHSNYEC
jgi:hypothetical protein